MKCNTVLKRLDGFRTGELNRLELEAVGQHLSFCKNCTQELNAIRRVAAAAAWLGAEAPAGILEAVQENTVDQYAEVDTELGKFSVAFSGRGITMLRPRAPQALPFEAAYERRFGRRPRLSTMPESYGKAVKMAAAGTALGVVPVDLSGLSAFEQKVLTLLRKIPHGEVRTYGWLAREAGSPRAVRAVGNTMARNPVPLLLPCHRVVPSTGGIGNYAFGSDLKRKLLRKEAAPVREIERLGREGVRYIGSITTQIYCFPTCRDALRIQSKNRVPFRTLDEAGTAGFHPCKHCRP